MKTEAHNFTGQSPRHTHYNTTIELNQTHPEFSYYFPQKFPASNAINSSIDSPDGGKTWTIESITMEPVEFVDSDE